MHIKKVMQPSTMRVNHLHMGLNLTLGNYMMFNISQWLIHSQILFASVRVGG